MPTFWITFSTSMTCFIISNFGNGLRYVRRVMMVFIWFHFNAYKILFLNYKTCWIPHDLYTLLLRFRSAFHINGNGILSPPKQHQKLIRKHALLMLVIPPSISSLKVLEPLIYRQRVFVDFCKVFFRLRPWCQFIHTLLQLIH